MDNTAETPVKSERLWVTLSPERANLVKEWAEKANLSHSQFLGMCAWIGAKRFVDAFETDLFWEEEAP